MLTIYPKAYHIRKLTAGINTTNTRKLSKPFAPSRVQTPAGCHRPTSEYQPRKYKDKCGRNPSPYMHTPHAAEYSVYTNVDNISLCNESPLLPGVQAKRNNLMSIIDTECQQRPLQWLRHPQRSKRQTTSGNNGTRSSGKRCHQSTGSHSVSVTVRRRHIITAAAKISNRVS